MKNNLSNQFKAIAILKDHFSLKEISQIFNFNPEEEDQFINLYKIPIKSLELPRVIEIRLKINGISNLYELKAAIEHNKLHEIKGIKEIRARIIKEKLYNFTSMRRTDW